ncbi:MAG: ExbD/TolR family protein [Brevundimonas sp.]|jgi:biopolymer transport protein TolR|uniref:ExbD/TolR family protein n=1 Tax=Brevundimonas sp. TaxID=1871086 RepID=UPI0018331136|nr:ExbD/TolR family protein [Brevundimonas sp.]MBA4805736.1 ExbD/TolR family protein [Brevundimonas sp.]
MALGGAAGGGGHVRGRRRARRRPLSEINVTPLVDVMLVLLIIFMISAPLLTTGVEVELPKTEASAVDTDSEPVTVSIDRNGAIFVGEGEVEWEQLLIRVAQEGGEGARERPVFIRADGRAPYQAVARVMARLSGGGFSKLNLITDTSGSTAEG